MNLTKLNSTQKYISLSLFHTRLRQPVLQVSCDSSQKYLMY
jgi:hypothetical protein